MMGGLSLNASGAALDSSFGVFEVAHGACCDAGRQVEAQQGAGRSADAGARDRVGVGAPGCRTAAVARRPWAGVRVRRSTIRFYPHHYMQPQCALSAARAPSTRHHAASELQKTRGNLWN